jgi:hypothetical protein
MQAKVSASGLIKEVMDDEFTFIYSVCGIPDPNFFYPGSRVKKIPDPGSVSASKQLSIFNTENCIQALGNMNRDVHPGPWIHILIFYPSRIPDPGVKKAQDPESGSATLLFIKSPIFKKKYIQYR